MALTKRTRPIQSLQRGLIVLEAIGNAGRPLSLAELKDTLRMDRSSLFRLANTLTQRGFLAQSADRKAYALGPAIWRLAGQIRHSSSLAHVARQYVASLAAATGETTHLALRHRAQVIFIEHEPAEHPVGVSMGSGRAEPLHCTALGKALIADLDAEAMTHLYGDTVLKAYTDRTIRSIRELVRECQKVRSNGFAVDDEEFRKGVRCVAAPIRDCGGQIAAAIGISAPSERLPRRCFREVGGQVRQTADEISTKLGHLPSRHEEISRATGTVD